MSNYARVVVEIDKNIVEQFEAFLETHPLKNCLVEKRQIFNGDMVYDFQCNHYERIEPNLEKWMYETFDSDDWKMLGIDEYSHWEDGGMDCPSIWLDIVIGE